MKKLDSKIFICIITSQFISMFGALCLFQKCKEDPQLLDVGAFIGMILLAWSIIVTIFFIKDDIFENRD